MSQKLSFQIDPVIEGRARLTDAQALELYHAASLHDLGSWAQAVARRMHPEDYRTYVIDRNINYTNVCTARCTFCAFRRDHEDADSYTLDYGKIGEKIRELVAINGTQVLMQGGMNDRLPIEWYEDLLRYIKSTFPTVHIHAFSPPEFVEFERFFGLDVREITRRFHKAGLDTIPGGGGEIFAPRVRKRIGIGKASGDDWLRVMRVAHEEGLNTSATMLIGHIEFVRERIEHMAAIRDMQDYALALQAGVDEDAARRWYVEAHDDVPTTIERARTRWPGVFAQSVTQHSALSTQHFGSYTAFIHWPFQRENTPLGRAQEWDPDVHGPFDDSTNEDVLRGRVVRMAGADEYLRMLTIARLYLDNVPSLQSSWVTMGPKVGQLAMMFGANDMGSVMMEENVVSAAGTTYRLAERDICRLIRDAGWVPAQRDQYYNVLRRHDGPDAPDLQLLAAPPMRDVRKVDKQFIGAAPGLDDGADRSERVQLPILGDR
ncbi:MAG: Cyclic dehypoxanthine futalosine synthase [uncultured Phycisphaerae bacterium]|uniref:Cyclic dehypoxanthine futalosine synthase n=1 Tax=uncultured Phycisphaerae bacterium TaxID=904963 RepID=A0A6J4P5R9_9BACT|nr:MAG: Cyclic dehypoxanthine futalosine synthase [uncultured Phycisphaerae bacterium]